MVYCKKYERELSFSTECCGILQLPCENWSQVSAETTGPDPFFSINSFLCTHAGREHLTLDY